MRKFKILTIVFLFISNISCDKKLNKAEKSVILQTKDIDSLVFIKDIIVFSNSSEGEKLLLFKNKRTKDSVIKSTVYGEMGKVDFTFIFNQELLKANRLTSNYEEPIYINSIPKIKEVIEENLNTSIFKKNELINIFLEDIKFFRKKKYATLSKIDSVVKKWEGIYYLSPNSIDSGEIGSYYIEIFKSHSDFGFSGNEEFNIEVDVIEEDNKLYLFDKKKINLQVQLEDALAVLSKIDDKTFVKSKMINVKRNDIHESAYGYSFNWKKTVEEVPDTPE